MSLSLQGHCRVWETTAGGSLRRQLHRWRCQTQTEAKWGHSDQQMSPVTWEKEAAGCHLHPSTLGHSTDHLWI